MSHVQTSHHDRVIYCVRCNASIPIPQRADSFAVASMAEQFEQRHRCHKEKVEREPTPLDRWKSLFANVNV